MVHLAPNNTPSTFLTLPEAQKAQKDTKRHQTKLFQLIFGSSRRGPKLPQKFVSPAFSHAERPRGTSGKVPEPGGKKFGLEKLGVCFGPLTNASGPAWLELREAVVQRGTPTETRSNYMSLR